MVQPLDVGFFRSYKRLLKRISEAALMDDRINDLTDRYGVMRINSLIFDQLSADVYQDLIRYAWRKTDPNFSADELTIGEPPPSVDEINFNFKKREVCEHEDCTKDAFIRCSHCGKLLCLHHFLERQCFHYESDSANNGSVLSHGASDSSNESRNSNRGPYNPHDELRA